MFDKYTGNEIRLIDSSTYQALFKNDQRVDIYRLEFAGWYGNEVDLDGNEMPYSGLTLNRYAFADSSINTFNISNNGINVEDYAFDNASIGTLNI